MTSNKKRVVARGITFINNKVLLIERYRKEKDQMLHYFTIPGGGIEKDESPSQAAIREVLEETTCNVSIIKYLGEEHYPGGICHWYYCNYIDGTPKLSGEEKIRNNPDNHYKVVLIDMNNIDEIPILGMGKKYIKDCYILYQNK